jgi:Rod binding domain-containing protein
MGTSIGIGMLSAQTSMLQSREDSVMGQMNSTNTANDSARIDKGSREFEAILIGNWLQQAEQSFATVPGADDGDQDAGRDQVMSFGVQSLATSLAASGGFGIGKMIAAALHANADKDAARAASKGEPVK